MSSGSGLGDIIATSGLAVRVFAAYKDAPNYGHVSREVVALQVLIDKVARHLRSTTRSSDDRLDGQKILKGCQGALQDLYSLMEKYRRLASTNKQLVLTMVKLGNKDITTLHEQLISNTGLLNGYVRRFVVPGIILVIGN